MKPADSGRCTVLGACCASLLMLLGVSTATAQSSAQSALPTIHTRPAVTGGQALPVGPVPGTSRLPLTIGLPLRDPAGLQALLQNLYTPGGAGYRHFLSVQEFTDRFGPTQADYDKVVAFAAANKLTVLGTSTNRQIVRVEGAVADIEQAFHVKMGVYRHPTEARNFFAPDREPSVDLDVPLWHVGGLDDFSLPQPNLVERPTGAPEDDVPHPGSGPGGFYLASDMRAAYYGNGPLTGAGQSVALLEFQSYWPPDLTSYYATTGQIETVPVNNVLLDGKSLCTAACKDGETMADINQAIGMAPGLSQVLVYIGSSEVDILNQIAADNAAKQISISYSWGPADPTSDDPIFMEFAAQGQSVFVASGDCHAYVPGATGGCVNGVGVYPAQFPQEDSFVTTVGGTDLTTTGPGGAWAAELGWSHSGGGYADGIALPGWQAGIVGGAANASVGLRNVPDVAADANTDNYNCREGICATGGGGTSFAAPRWAGFMALVNQQAAANGRPPIGFLNPAIYALGAGPAYGQAMHDITSGSNVGFSAVPGYDLVTGWGSPNGQALIDQLAGASPLAAAVAPGSGSVETGTTATLFAAMINAGPTSLGNCRISLLPTAPAGLTLAYQTTDPVTNAPTGTPNAPANIDGHNGLQTFVLTFEGASAFSAPDLPLDFDCDGTAPAAGVPGVDTVDLAVSSTPVPDIVALAETATHDGIVHIGAAGGAFAVATSNAGIAAPITATVDQNGADLPLAVEICQTAPATGQCVAPPAASVAIGNFAAGATPTFSIFAAAAGSVPFNPALNRLFVRFRDGEGNDRGAASVAIETE